MADKKKVYLRKVCQKKKAMATQVTGRDIDVAFEMMCEDPKTNFDTHNLSVFKRKKQKYGKLFLGGKILRTSNEELGRKVDYNFGPVTIHKNTRNFL